MKKRLTLNDFKAVRLGTAGKQSNYILRQFYGGNEDPPAEPVYTGSGITNPHPFGS